MHRLLFLFAVLFLSINLVAQTNNEFYFPFDDSAGTGTLSGDPEFGCGVDGNAIILDGSNDRITFSGELVNVFDRADFTVSFYIKPTKLTGSQDIISKLTDCNGEQEFSIVYQAFNQTITALLSENPNKQVRIAATIEPDNCWQHIAVVRDDKEFRLFINGELKSTNRSSLRLAIGNGAPLSIANSPCLSLGQERYKGFLDELRIYAQALDKAEIAGLYLSPDKVLNRDTLLILGDAVDIRISNTCADNFIWTPVEGVADPKNPQTSISPPITGRVAYYLKFDDGNCIARDSIVIRVVNPDELNCEEIFLPNAFTPNDDNVNDTYGISNPFVVENLISFEIFDRWGNRVFFSENILDRWDGTFQSQEVNPGVLLYRIRYSCRGEAFTKTGSVMVLR